MLLIDPQLVRDVLAANRADDLYGPLQGAIELEHSTIPVYLTAMYSIKPGANRPVRIILRDIVIQEMLHMTIASNVLNAIGGSPGIDTPDFVPKYPGPLPMNINSSLHVHLGPLSFDRVRDEFMKIEEPEKPIDFPIHALFSAPSPPTFATIGQFYAALITRIKALGDSIFIPDHSKQVVNGTTFDPSVIFEITNAASAIQGLNIIVQQGEGTPDSPLAPGGSPAPGGNIAHYYRFEQIIKHRTLVPDQTSPKGFSFGLPEVSLDPTGIFDMVKDPKSAAYKPGSLARKMSDQFNQTYTQLLKLLHATFNGSPATIAQSIAFMQKDLRSAALSLVATIDDVTGKNATPTFEYV